MSLVTSQNLETFMTLETFENSQNLELLIEAAEEQKIILSCVFCRIPIGCNFSQMCSSCARDPMRTCRVCESLFPWYDEGDLCGVCAANPTFHYPVLVRCQSCNFPLHPSLEYYCEDCYVRIHYREPDLEDDSDDDISDTASEISDDEHSRYPIDYDDEPSDDQVEAQNYISYEERVLQWLVQNYDPIECTPPAA